MTATLLLATNDGLSACVCEAGTWRVNRRSLDRHAVTSIIAQNGAILAGTQDGIFRSVDGGESWDERSGGLDIRHVRWLAFDPSAPNRCFAGTEPAGIFSSDGEEGWAGRPEVEVLRDGFGWWLPYSPEAGCVRGFAFHRERVYAAVEVGGVLRSDDGGVTWSLAEGSSGEPVFDEPAGPHVFADVHSVEAHPSSPDLVFAITANGLYRSDDGGATWAVSHRGHYCRAAWIDPSDADHVVLGVADSVSNKHGRIEESRDGGRSWQRASDGLDLPWPDRMVERFLRHGDELLAVTSDGRLYAGAMGDLQWRRILPEVEGVNAVAIATAR